jgi:predicted GIY-YIG superfamily endonuclease
VISQTALYRHWDSDNNLLYVGISLSAMQRLAQHKEKSRWFSKIASVTIEYHPTREAALLAERAAIANERPAFNVVFNGANDNSPRPGPATAGLVGMFGHTLDDDGEIDWQFEVVQFLGEGIYLVQLFSWMDGCANKIVPLTAQDIAQGRCNFYQTRDDWLRAADDVREERREMRRLRRQGAFRTT